MTDAERSAPARQRLENLPNSPRSTGAQAAARSQMVRRLRIALPVLGLVLIGAFFLNTQSTGVDDAFLKDFENLDATPEELRMVNPRFAGVDDKGNPYEITANAGKKKADTDKVVLLEKPRAVTNSAKSETIVSANKGVYESEAKLLELRDQVTVEHRLGGKNYTLTTSSATVSIDDDTVHSDSGVAGTSSDGNTLQADTMRAYNAEGRVVFEGNFRMRIYPKSLERDIPGATEQPQIQ